MMKDFVDGNLVFTNNDKIECKQDMFNQSKKLYPDITTHLRKMSNTPINTDRINGVQG